MGGNCSRIGLVFYAFELGQGSLDSTKDMASLLDFFWNRWCMGLDQVGRMLAAKGCPGFQRISS
jgi:hypothetical protein